jgi:hypothetical protein
LSILRFLLFDDNYSRKSEIKKINLFFDQYCWLFLRDIWLSNQVLRTENRFKLGKLKRERERLKTFPKIKNKQLTLIVEREI